MFKYITTVIAALILFVTVNFANAGFEELKPGTIMFEGALYLTDFSDFIKMTSDPKIRHYKIIVHSPGGDAFSTIAIINRVLEMKARGITFETETYGWCSSAGSFLFLLGDKRTAHIGTVFMFHTMQMAMGEYRWENQDLTQRKFRQIMDNKVTQLFRNTTGASEEIVQMLFYNKKIPAYFMGTREAFLIGGIITHLIDNTEETKSEVTPKKLNKNRNHKTNTDRMNNH